MQEEKALRIKDAVVTIDTPMVHESPDGGKTVRSRPFREGPETEDKIWDPDFKGYIVNTKPGNIKDKYVQQVKEKFEQRSQTGIKKYGTTLERDDLNKEDWLTHLEEELMDSLLYIQVLKDKLK